jgi:hypothetical protein
LNRFSNTKVIQSQLLKLNSILKNMLNPLWHMRPECSDVLASSKDWMINKNDLDKTKLNQLEILDYLRKQTNTFFYDIFNFMVNYEALITVSQQRHLPSNITVLDNYFTTTFDQIQIIAIGGFGTVYKVKHKSSGEIFAMKCYDLNSKFKICYLLKFINLANK